MNTSSDTTSSSALTDAQLETVTGGVIGPLLVDVAIWGVEKYYEVKAAYEAYKAING